MSHPAPIPCAHCGTNFMRRDLDPDAPKLCNNCIVKDQQRNPKKEVKLEKVKLLIEVDRKTQIEIEEFCMNKGTSISDYFVNLHKTYQSPGYIVMSPEMQKMHEEFESMAHEPDESPVMVRQRKSRGGKK